MNIQFRQTPNYTKSDGTKKIGFVLHGTAGAYNGAVEWLCNSQAQASAHYVIGRNEGEVIQLVKEEDISWHAGIIKNPNERAKKVIPKNILGQFKNPNMYFIGIEFAWGYDINKDGVINDLDKTLTEWQINTAAQIMYDSGIYTYDTMLTHPEITTNRSDDISSYFDAIDKRIAKLQDRKETLTKEEIKSRIISLINQL